MAESSVVTKQKGTRRKTGHGKRSKARVGQKRKTHPTHKKNTDELGKKADSPYDSLDIPADWLNVSGESVDVRLCQVAYQEQEHCPPLVVTRSLVINKAHQTWRVHVHGHLLDPSNISSLADVPVTLDGNAASLLLKNLSQLKTCVGNPEEKFVSLGKKKRNGCFLSPNKEVVAYLDEYACVTLKNQVYTATIRSSKCFLLTDEERCPACSRYRKNLLAQHSRILRLQTKERSKNINFRFMKTPDRLSALRKARQTLRNRDRRLARLKNRLEKLTTERGVEMDDDVVEEMTEVIDEHSSEIDALPGSDFRRIFWDQQVAALKAKRKTGIRWHPLFVRWCLNLSRVSPKAYEVMRESGIQLPTRRTLNDYTHWVSAEPGFHNDIDDMLVKEARVEELNEWQRYVVLIFDEMKIREDLVYDRTGCHLHGFINLGDINNQLQQLEQNVQNDSPHEHLATEMLTLMIRGLFIKLEFPYASFPTQGITGELLYWIVWEAVRRLEECNLKVIAFVCDGAKPNRKFLEGLGCEREMNEGVVYKTVNRYCHDRDIFFISDVPHLMKTTRNCWYSSKPNGTRYMWNNGKHILWSHLHSLHEHMQAESGLYIGRRLTYDHLNLTSYSKMKVNLAAQVLSNSVRHGFEMMKNEEFQETARFCHMFDRFFDCLNTRRAGEGREKRKPDLEPYTSHEDERLSWLEKDFLGYLREWEENVEKRNGYSKDEKRRMTLSQETIKGLRMTVLSFVEMTRQLLKQNPGLFILSERFNQDPLESFFGQQRARGGRSDNPNTRTFLHNAQAIRVQRTLAIGHGGNVRKRQQQWTEDIKDLSRPICKRPRRSLQYQPGDEQKT